MVVAPGAAKWTRWLPIAAILLAVAVFFLLGFDRYLNFAALKDHRQMLVARVAEHPVLSGLIFLSAYTASTALSLPIASMLTVLGGFLFGLALGTFYVVIGATLGATMLFLAARSAIGAGLRARAGPWLAKLEDGFRRDGFFYLLFLRLVPAFPFFIVNLVPALLGMRLLPYAVATLIGILPGSIIYVFAGVGLGSVFDRGEEFSFSGILTPEMTLALIGLGLLVLLPIVIRKFRPDRQPGTGK